MKYLVILLLVFCVSCNEEVPPFPVLEHEELKADLVANYNAHKVLIQSIAYQVSAFKWIRSIEFKYGRGLYGIQVYCNSIHQNGDGKSINIKDINDPQLIPILKQEGISLNDLKVLKTKLDQVKCNSFFSFEDIDIYTGKKYIDVQFQYNIWNGINFYYYKVFDQKMDSGILALFNSNFTNLNEGMWKNKGGIVDSNAVWYYLNH